MLLFPDPFGPTIAVMPSLKTISVRSGKGVHSCSHRQGQAVLIVVGDRLFSAFSRFSVSRRDLRLPDPVKGDIGAVCFDPDHNVTSFPVRSGIVVIETFAGLLA